MSAAAIIAGFIGLGLTIIGLIVKITQFTTRVEVYVDELRSERKHVRRVPFLEYKIGAIERHLELSVPELPHLNGDGGGDSE